MLLALMERNHDEAAQLLRLLERDFGDTCDGVMEGDGFPAFKRSEQYVKLLRERAAARASTQPTTLPSWKF